MSPIHPTQSDSDKTDAHLAALEAEDPDAERRDDDPRDRAAFERAHGPECWPC